MAVKQFDGVINLDLPLKAEVKEFENENKQKFPYVQYYVEVAGIGGSIEKVVLGPVGTKKDVGKYIMENRVNFCIDSYNKAKSIGIK